MSLEIYPADLHTRYEINHAISISMSVYYNDIGKIQLIVPVNDYNIMALKNEAIVYDTARKTTYIIVDVKCDTNTNEIIANGYTSEYLLNKRCITFYRKITNIESGVYNTISDNLRGLPRITLAPLKGYTETFRGDDSSTADVDESAVFGGQLMDELQNVLEYGEFGRRMNWNGDSLSWQFEVYKGNDLTGGIHRVAFVEEQGTCSNLVINEDISTFKNYGYAAYKYDGVTKVVSVGSAKGADRNEKWFESSVTNDNGESEASCRKRVQANIMMELGKYINRRSFSVSVDAEELGIRFNLGDIVSCVSNRFGVAFNARITGIQYTLDANGEMTEIVLGDPILTALGELKLNG